MDEGQTHQYHWRKKLALQWNHRMDAGDGLHFYLDHRVVFPMKTLDNFNPQLLQDNALPQIEKFEVLNSACSYQEHSYSS